MDGTCPHVDKQFAARVALNQYTSSGHDSQKLNSSSQCTAALPGEELRQLAAQNFFGRTSNRKAINVAVADDSNKDASS